MAIIEVVHLTKKFGDIIAVNDISFSVEEGIIFGLLGPNGAGKTTTIECMIGMKKPTSGEIQILGMDVLKVGKEIYDHIGVQLQETSYQDKVKVYELCDLFSVMYKSPVDYKPLLKKFNLDGRERAYINTLSGGQKQKVAIILALIANPKVIFLDELTTGLDPKARREMWDVVKNLKAEGRTVFLTTHYMEEAAYLCDQIGIIDGGQLLVVGEVDGVIDHAKLNHLVSFKAKEEVAKLLEVQLAKPVEVVYEEGFVNVYSNQEDIISEVVLLLHKHQVDYKRINILRPSLEDAYLKLTGKEWEA